MRNVLTPHLHLASVLDLQVEHLRALGLRGLLLDLDCTLKDYHASQVGAPVRAWLRQLRDAGIGLCLLSNGKHQRIERFSQELEIPFIARAFKPLPRGCRQGLQVLGLPAHQTAMIGDQLFADVLAGRLAGLFTILVRPTSPAEPWFTRVKRPWERLALRWLQPSTVLPDVFPGAPGCPSELPAEVSALI
jgi:HAD superfamily phosphatase (TIGR01668 family)